MDMLGTRKMCKWNRDFKSAATKTRNLPCKIAAKRVEEFHHPRSNLSCNKSGCCKLREYCHLIWQNYAVITPYTGVTSLAAKQVCLGAVKHATGTDVCAKRSYSLLSATTRLIRGWQNMKDRHSTHFSAMLQIKLNVFVVRFTVHLQWVRWAGSVQWVLVSGGCIFYLQVDRSITGSL